jgi:hypothetical protein
MDPQSRQHILRDARQRTRELLDRLLHQQAELESFPSMLPAETMHEGRIALQGAIDSARAMLQSIDDALAAAPNPETVR